MFHLISSVVRYFGLIHWFRQLTPFSKKKLKKNVTVIHSNGRKILVIFGFIFGFMEKSRVYFCRHHNFKTITKCILVLCRKKLKLWKMFTISYLTRKNKNWKEMALYINSTVDICLDVWLDGTVRCLCVLCLLLTLLKKTRHGERWHITRVQLKQTW